MVMQRTGPKRPKGLRPHLDVKLKKGWRYEDRRGVFVPEKGDEFAPADDLPATSRIVPMAPHLMSADPTTLSPDERNLARYVQVVFPPSASRETYQERISEWPCVEEVRFPPDVSLPDSKRR